MAEEAINIEDQNTGGDQVPPPQQPPLPDEQRAKLDGIVVQMFKQNASKDEIQSVVDDFKKKYTSSIPPEVVADSHSKITTALNSPEANSAIDKINADKFYSDIYKGQQAGASGKDATAIKQPLPVRLHSQVQKERDSYRASVNDNPDLVRPVLTEMKRQNPSNPQNKELDKAMYLSDANKRPHEAGAVKYYADQIGSGKMQYDANKKQIVKPVGPIDAFFNGMKKHSDDMDDFKFLTTHNDDEVIDYLNKQGPVDPDRPVQKAAGALSSLSEMQGSNAVPMVKMGGPALILNPYGDVAAAFGAAIGAGAGSQDFANSSYVNTLKQSYHENVNKGLEPHEALRKAEDDAHLSSMLAAGQGIAMSAGGLLAKETEFSPVRYSKKNLNALVDVGNNIKTLAKTAVPEISTQAGIAGAVKAINNAHQGKVTSEGVLDDAGGMALFTAGMIGLKVPGAFKGGGLTPAGRANLMDLYAKAPENAVNAGLSNAVQHEAMTPQQAGELKVEINAHKEATKGKPDLTASVTPEAEDFIDKYESGQIPKYATEAIKKIAKANGVESKPEEPELSVEDIYNKLKHRQSAGKISNFEDLGSKLTGINKTMYEKDPEGFLKYVAGQAHGGDATRTELESGEGITNSLINHATSKYPEHIIKEDATTGKGQSIVPNSDKINPTKELQTWDIGDMAGKPEDEAAKKHLEGVVKDWDTKPAGKEGETFGEFVQRVIPHFDQILKSEAKNTTVITHSSVLKAFKVWDEMGRPDIEKLTPEQKTEFATAYNKEETQNADLETFKGSNGDIHVIRHGQTEDNAKNNFRSGDTNLTGKGIKQAEAVGQELKEKTAGDVPKIITSDLPRAIHTSNLITDELGSEKPHHTVSTPNIVNIKNKEDAIFQQATNEVGIRNEAAVRSGMGRQDSEPKESSNEGGRSESGRPSAEEKSTPQEEGKTVGVRHESLKKIADRLGLEQPEKGTVLSAQEQTERGRALLKAGADPEKVQEDFDNHGKVDADSISVARAHYENLVKDVQAAYDKGGKESQEYKEAKKKADEWQKEVMKPMGTASGGAFTALQGETDVDTGSFISMSRAFEDKYGKAPNPKQEAELKAASDKVSELNKKVSDLEQKLTEAIDKSVGTKEKATYTNKAKAVADAFRKLKTKPFTFKDENGNEINVTKMGIDWNDVVEAGAKVIEKTGEIADGIAAAIEKIKDADWYKGLSDSDKDKFAKQLEEHYAVDAPELAYTDLAERLSDQKGNKFKPQDAKDIWEYAKETYLRKGSGFDTMVNGTAVDLGLTPEQVRNAITSPKSAAKITDEMYFNRYKEQQAIRDARLVLKTANKSKFDKLAIVRFAKATPNFFFTLKTALHGTVGNITHSGMNTFLPFGGKWKTFWPNWAKSFKYSFGGLGKKGIADYQQEMTDLVHRPQFAFWKRNGLAVDPVKSYDDYQQFTKGIAKLGEMGDRGFNALKLQRYDLAEYYYNKLSNEAKSDPQTAKEIAKIVNHSTGTADVPVPKLIGTAFFAPRLEASRWTRIITEPYRAAKTIVNWKEATSAEKVQAKIVGARAAEMASVYLSALAANSAALAATGSNQKINYSDPTAYDWLKFKAGGETLDLSGGMLSLMHYLGTIAKEGVGAKKKVAGQDEDRAKTMFKTTGNYVRGKLSPFASTGADVITQSDYNGRPLPWSSDKGNKFQPKYGWWEYISDQQLPIFVSEGFKSAHDQMRDAGVPEPTTNQVLKGILTGAVSGATGARLNTDYKADKKENSKPKGQNRD